MEVHILIILILAVIFGLYMAWGIGANDVANAMGTSVGSGALTLRNAVIVAAILEFGGAFLAGSHVSETVRKGIVDPAIFTGDGLSFMLGMLAALLAAGMWLQIASWKGWPVSTTHSIVGAVVGFGAAYGGISAVHWDKVGGWFHRCSAG
jgi:phosphate/sulfate permease